MLPLKPYCPPCEKCAFKAGAPVAEAGRVTEVIVARANYGCVRSGGAEIVRTETGKVGAMRPDGFYPITEAGAEFHRQQAGSPLAAYL